MAGFDTEPKTFAPIPTGYQNFADAFRARGDATGRPIDFCSNQLLIWRCGAETLGWEVVQSLCTYAEPGGRIVASAYTRLCDELLYDLRRALPDATFVLRVARPRHRLHRPWWPKVGESFAAATD